MDNDEPIELTFGDVKTILGRITALETLVAYLFAIRYKDRTMAECKDDIDDILSELSGVVKSIDPDLSPETHRESLRAMNRLLNGALDMLVDE